MFEAIAIILVLLWLVGLVFSYTASGYIHLLLAGAAIIMLLSVLRGKDPLR